MSKKFLENYINAYSPVSEECEGQKIWTDYIRGYVDRVESDNYGTVFGVIEGESRYKVVIEAHCDEIAWIITHIDSSGLIYVTKHGGSDAAIAPSKKILVHTRKNGKVPGVFGFPAIHTRKTADEKVSKVEDLFIDLGFDSKAAVEKLGVEVGNVITFDETFSVLGDYYVGKSLDNKIGGYIIAQVARKLKENSIKLPYDLYVVNSVQEEVGLLGARNIAQQLKANVAIVHDVCHSTHDTPGISKKKSCDITSGNGPTLEYASQNHRKLLEFIREVADKNKIPYQVEIGSAGNDTMGFFFANTVTAIIASPLRYMHTTVEMCNKKDVDNAIELFYQCLVSMDCRSWKYYEF